MSFRRLLSNLFPNWLMLLHMHVCVEGVEDKNQCDALKDMNVDLIQGYLV